MDRRYEGKSEEHCCPGGLQKLTIMSSVGHQSVFERQRILPGFSITWRIFGGQRMVHLSPRIEDRSAIACIAPQQIFNASKEAFKR